MVPSCTSLSAATAATGLLIEAAWNRVIASTASRVLTLATPKPFAHSIWKLRKTATLTPGTSYCRITSSMNVKMGASFE